jgi:DNA-binding NarL/FixJ family response regulator
MSQTTIIIVEDQEFTRRGLKLALDRMPDMQVVGEAVDGSGAVKLAQSCGPDVVLMDLVLPGMDGIEAVRRIKENQPEIKVLMFTAHGEESEVCAALGAGADGYCLKGAIGEELRRAIQAVVAGKVWLDTAVANDFLHDYVSRQKLNKISPSMTVPDFSPVELTVLEGIVDGLSKQQIAGKMNDSAETVTDNIRSMLKKMQSVDWDKLRQDDRPDQS